ncbi:hypothetical protein BH11ACT8_BH11ACT8_34070 [soil metagenome]
MTATIRPADSRSTTGDADLDPVGEMFASRSVPVHLVRGGLGLVLLVVGLAMAHTSALWLLLVPLTVVCWRGCMSCWTIGLIATRARTCSLPK